MLLIDTFIEEFYPVHENVIIYKNSFSFDPSAEGIFLHFKMGSLDMDLCLTRTLIFQIKGKKK